MIESFLGQCFPEEAEGLVSHPALPWQQFQGQTCQGRCWRAAPARLQQSPPAVQRLCLFSHLRLGDRSFLCCKSSSAEKTTRSQATLFSLYDICKGRQSLLLPFSGSGPLKHLPSLLGGGWVFLNKVAGNWHTWRTYPPLLLASTQKIKLQLNFNSEKQARAYILQLIST